MSILKNVAVRTAIARAALNAAAARVTPVLATKVIPYAKVGAGTVGALAAFGPLVAGIVATSLAAEAGELLQTPRHAVTKLTDSRAPVLVGVTFGIPALAGFIIEKGAKVLENQIDKLGNKLAHSRLGDKLNELLNAV